MKVFNKGLQMDARILLADHCAWFEVIWESFIKSCRWMPGNCWLIIVHVYLFQAVVCEQKGTVVSHLITTLILH